MASRLLIIFTSRPARIWMPVVAFCTCLAIALGTSPKSQPIYTATARIWFPSRAGTVPETADAFLSQPGSNLTFGPNALRTAGEIIHSRSVTRRAFDELKKKFGVKCPALENLKVAAKPIAETDILEVKYTNPDQELAKSVLESILAAFCDEDSLQIAGPIRQSKKRLESQLRLAQQQHAQMNHKVKQFQDSTNSVDLEADVVTLTKQRSAIEQTIEECKHEMSALKSKLSYAQKQLGFGPESVVAVQKLSEDEVMKSLRQSIGQTQVALIQLRSKYQEEHPKVKRLKSTLEETERGLEARYTALIGRSDFKESFVAAANDTALKKTIEEMAEASSTMAALRAKIASLSESLATVKSKLVSIPSRQLELADINRTHDLTTKSLAAIESELQRVHLTESVNRDSNIQIIDEPTVSSDSSQVPYIFCLGLSFFVALAVALVQFLLSPKRVSARQLIQLMPVRIIGYLPNIDGLDSRQSLSASDWLRLARNDWFDWFVTGGSPVLVTSGGNDDGRSAAVYALSVCLAEAGKNVLLIDANNINPTLDKFAGITETAPGLSNYLREPRLDHWQIMHAISKHLTVIPAGGVTNNDFTIKDPKFTRLIGELNGSFDTVIIDSGDCTSRNFVTPNFDCKWLAIVRLRRTLSSSLRKLQLPFEILPPDQCAVLVTDASRKDIYQLKHTVGVPASQSAESQTSELALF